MSDKILRKFIAYINPFIQTFQLFNNSKKKCLTNSQNNPFSTPTKMRKWKIYQKTTFKNQHKVSITVFLLPACLPFNENFLLAVLLFVCFLRLDSVLKMKLQHFDFHFPFIRDEQQAKECKTYFFLASLHFLCDVWCEILDIKSRFSFFLFACTLTMGYLSKL